MKQCDYFVVYHVNVHIYFPIFDSKKLNYHSTVHFYENENTNGTVEDSSSCGIQTLAPGGGEGRRAGTKKHFSLLIITSTLTTISKLSKSFLHVKTSIILKLFKNNE